MNDDKVFSELWDTSESVATEVYKMNLNTRWKQILQTFDLNHYKPVRNKG